MNKNETLEKIQNEEDYINLPKYNNSLKMLLNEHPTGVSDSIICKALGLSQTELDEMLNSAIIRFKESVGVKHDD